MDPAGLWRRTWRDSRPELALLAVGSLVASLAWRSTSRPMVDTEGYRRAAEILTEGWGQVLDRTPGYPLLLLATGADDGSGVVLFAVQLALHALCVVLMVDLARSCGVGRRGRLALVLLLVAPPVMLRVPLEGTEGLAAVLLTTVGWLLLTPPRRSPVGRLLAIGAACGAAALVRPTFALLFVPAALVVAVLGPLGRPRSAAGSAPGSETRSGALAAEPVAEPPPGRAAWTARVAAAALVALPAVVVVGGYSAANALRFDSPGMTPLAAYHLSSRTSPYVEELPRSYEPARSVLIEERDRALLRGDEVAPENFIWRARDDLQRVTGLSGPELDRYVLEMDLRLILGNPIEYLDTVVIASTNYAVIDSQPQILALGRPAVWGMTLVHWVLLAVGAVLAATVPGLWLVGRVDRRSATVMTVALVLAAYTMAVSVMVESGTARLRAPSEPLLALVLVVAASCLRAVLADRRSDRGEPSGSHRVT